MFQEALNVTNDHDPAILSKIGKTYAQTHDYKQAIQSAAVSFSPVLSSVLQRMQSSHIGTKRLSIHYSVYQVSNRLLMGV